MFPPEILYQNIVQRLPGLVFEPAIYNDKPEPLTTKLRAGSGLTKTLFSEGCVCFASELYTVFLYDDGDIFF